VNVGCNLKVREYSGFVYTKIEIHLVSTTIDTDKMLPNDKLRRANCVGGWIAIIAGNLIIVVILIILILR
jgi:hypothetical protein